MSKLQWWSFIHTKHQSGLRSPRYVEEVVIIWQKSGVLSNEKLGFFQQHLNNCHSFFYKPER